jgi:hypothetical protein
MHDPDWVAVLKLHSQEEASIVRGFLESEGIPSTLSYEAWEKVMGLPHSPVWVLVPRDRREEACRLLRERGTSCLEEEA